MDARYIVILAMPVALAFGCTSNNPYSGRTGSDASAEVPQGTDAQPPLDGGPLIEAIALPDGSPGIAFDDLRYAPKLGKILAPAGRTGNLDLVDPVTLAVDSIGGFSRSETFVAGAHSSGSTSADEGEGLVFAIDHETTSIRVVDPIARTVVASATSGADPDYLRYVAATRELWATEPLTGIEIFSVSGKSAPVHSSLIAISGGPEAIVVDEMRGRAYTNAFLGQTFAVDLVQRTVVETWKNGCALSLGLALDEERGFLFVACAAGSLVVLDVAHGGTMLGTLSQGAGLDILSYDPSLRHLYVQGATSANLGIVGISSGGVPSLLGTVDTAASSTSTTDGHGHVFVAAPEQGGLIRVRDEYPRVE